MVSRVRLFVVVVALGAVVGGGGCATQVVDENEQQQGLMAGKTIEVVLKEHTDQLMSLPGVVGTAIGTCEGNPCIKVLVVKKFPALVKRIPPMLEGYPVVIEETGEIRILHPS
jgi:hypothetical protein